MGMKQDGKKVVKNVPGRSARTATEERRSHRIVMTRLVPVARRQSHGHCSPVCPVSLGV